jgi:hypothetical protein
MPARVIQAAFQIWLPRPSVCLRARVFVAEGHLTLFLTETRPTLQARTIYFRLNFS